MSVKTILPTTLGTLSTGNTSRFVSKGVSHARVDWVMIIPAAVCFAIVSQMVLVTQLALGYAVFELVHLRRGWHAKF